jgi:hypothetical protein
MLQVALGMVPSRNGARVLKSILVIPTSFEPASLSSGKESTTFTFKVLLLTVDLCVTEVEGEQNGKRTLDRQSAIAYWVSATTNKSMKISVGSIITPLLGLAVAPLRDGQMNNQSCLEQVRKESTDGNELKNDIDTVPTCSAVVHRPTRTLIWLEVEDWVETKSMENSGHK